MAKFIYKIWMSMSVPQILCLFMILVTPCRKECFGLFVARGELGPHSCRTSPHNPLLFPLRVIGRNNFYSQLSCLPFIRTFFRGKLCLYVMFSILCYVFLFLCFHPLHFFLFYVRWRRIYSLNSIFSFLSLIPFLADIGQCSVYYLIFEYVYIYVHTYHIRFVYM